MTRAFGQRWKCKNCGVEHVAENEFSQWCRAELLSSSNGLVVSDIDFIFHRYMVQRDRDVQYQMCVELKTRGADLLKTDSQYETLALDSKMQRTHDYNCERSRGRFTGANGSTIPQRIITPRGERPIWLNHYGWFFLRLSGTTPDNSEWIEWRRQRISRDQLKLVLQLDLNPVTLRPIDSRRHKRRKELPLFEAKE